MLHRFPFRAAAHALASVPLLVLLACAGGGTPTGPAQDPDLPPPTVPYPGPPLPVPHPIPPQPVPQPMPPQPGPPQPTTNVVAGAYVLTLINQSEPRWSPSPTPTGRSSGCTASARARSWA